MQPTNRLSYPSSLHPFELMLWSALVLVVLAFVVRAPLWNSLTAGAWLGPRGHMLTLGAPSFRCVRGTGHTTCDTHLGAELLRITYTAEPTLTCVASYGRKGVACEATYLYAPGLKPAALLPELRDVAPPIWSAQGVVVWFDSALESHPGEFFWLVVLSLVALVWARVARRRSGVRRRRHGLAAMVSILVGCLAMVALLVSTFVLGYDD